MEECKQNEDMRNVFGPLFTHPPFIKFSFIVKMVNVDLRSTSVSSI